MLEEILAKHNNEVTSLVGSEDVKPEKEPSDPISTNLSDVVESDVEVVKIPF
jgi:hypothetical protein